MIAGIGADHDGGGRLTPPRRWLLLLVAVWFSVAAAAPFWLMGWANRTDATHEAVEWSVSSGGCSAHWDIYVCGYAYDSDDGSPFHSSGSPSVAWVVLDLGSARSVTHARLRQQYATDWTIEYSTGDGTGPWTSAASVSGGSGSAITDTGVVPLAASATARYWMVHGWGQSSGYGGGWSVFDFALYNAADHDPDPTPTPTPSPSPSPGGGGETECVDEPIYGPPAPGEDPPPICDNANRRAATSDDLQWEDPAYRCAAVAGRREEARVDDSGRDVVSCEAPEGQTQNWNDVDVGSWTGGTYGARTSYIGEMINGGPMVVSGHTRPAADDLQTWCIPGVPDCDHVSSIGAGYGDVYASFDPNYPPSRKVARGVLIATVITSSGQRDFVCTNQDAGDLVFRGSAAMLYTDEWTCPFPTGLTGFVFIRSLVEAMDTRFYPVEPNPEREFQHYIMHLNYAVLTVRGYFTPGDELQGWPSCTDASPGEGCRPTVPGTWADDSYQAPTDDSDVDDNPIGPGPDDGVAGPISGEHGKPFLGYQNCVPGQDFLAVGEWVAWAGCHIYNGLILVINSIIDLLFPGQGIAEAFESFLATAETRVPFGWFAQVADTIEASAGAGADVLGSFTLTVGTASVSIGGAIADALAAVSPYRGLIFAGVAMVMVLGCLRWIMAAVGVSPSHGSTGGDA